MTGLSDLSYISNPAKIKRSRETIHQIAKRRFEESADNIGYIIYHEHKLEASATYGEIYEKSRKFAAALSRGGIKKGDVIVVCIRNSIEWIIIEFGIMLTGAIPLNSRVLRDDFSDLQHVISRAKPVALVFSDEYENAPQYVTDLLVAQISSTGSLTRAICVGKFSGDNVVNFKEMIEKEFELFDPDSVYIDPDDVVAIIRSSGSSGHPKLICHTHSTVLSSFGMAKGMNGIGSTTVRMVDSTFAWTSGSPMFELYFGGKLVSYRASDLPESIGSLLECARKEKVTVFSSTASVINAMAKRTDEMPDSVRCMFAGGAPIKKEWSAVLRKAPIVCIGYGCVETRSITVKIAIGGVDQIQANACGTPSYGTEIKLCDDDMKIVKRESMGNIYARNSILRSPGYYGDDEMTREAISPTGWYDTKDVGYIDKEGELYVIGRRDDTLQYGSQVVYCNEVETMVTDIGLPEINDVIIVPVDDDEQGQVCCFCILLSAGYDMTEEALKETLHTRIVNAKYRPHYLFIFDKFCYTATGKINRHDLRSRVQGKLSGE